VWIKIASLHEMHSKGPPLPSTAGLHEPPAQLHFQPASPANTYPLLVLLTHGPRRCKTLKFHHQNNVSNKVF
jgi:hypothetical protein